MPAPIALVAPAHPPLSAERAIQILQDRLGAGQGDNGPTAVAVPSDALRTVLQLVEGGAWDDFDGHRRWAGPWRPDDA